MHSRLLSKRPRSLDSSTPPSAPLKKVKRLHKPEATRSTSQFHCSPCQLLFRPADLVPQGKTLISMALRPSTGQNEAVLLVLDSVLDPLQQAFLSGDLCSLFSSTQSYTLIHQLSCGKLVEIQLPPLGEALHRVDYLGDGRYVVMRANAATENDCNGHVFCVDTGMLGKGGKVEARLEVSFHVGDGQVVDLQATGDGSMWVSLMGDSTGNLKCFDSWGSLVWSSSEASTCADLPPLDQPYALNVCSDGEVFFYYWADFPLVSLRDFEVRRVWEAPVMFSHAIAISPSRKLAIFAGGSRRDTSDFPFFLQQKRLFGVNLESSQVEELEFYDDNGQKLYCVGARDNHLYLRNGEGKSGEVFAMELKDS